MRYEDWDQIEEDLVNEVAGVGKGSAANLREELSLPGFHLACREAADGDTSRLKTADGIGQQTAERISEYALEVREI